MVLKIGHRGCSYAPENTLKAFEKAISLGAGMVECDARLTKDGKVVIIHDETVDRTTDGKGKVSEMNWEELRKLEVEDGEKIPSLEEVIDLVKGRIKLNVEIKDEKVGKKVAEMIVKNNFVEECLVSSSHYRALIEVKRVNDEIEVGLVFYSTKTNFRDKVLIVACRAFWFVVKNVIVSWMEKTKSKVINIHWLLATRRFLKFAHEKGWKVNVWTLNNLKRIEKMKKLGADGIFSDYPERIG